MLSSEVCHAMWQCVNQLCPNTGKTLIPNRKDNMFQSGVFGREGNNNHTNNRRLDHISWRVDLCQVGHGRITSTKTSTRDPKHVTVSNNGEQQE